MGTILFYIFESTLCLTILYFLFRLFFRKDTLFRTNRFLLLAGTMACTLLPLLQIDVPQYTTLQLPITTVRHLLTEKEIDVQREGGTGEKHLSEEARLLMAEKGEGIEGDRTNVIHTISVIWLLGGCYFIGALIVLAFLLLSTIRMRRLIRSYPACNYGKYKLVICPEKIVSFSWGHTIVLSQEDYERNPGEILLHEQMHLQHRHTLDLLWMECIVIFHWFNPAAWLLMRELREVHEYEADNGVINNGIDATEYQLLLVKKSVGARLYSMACGFNHSKLKNRITMMLKRRTNNWARLKLLLFVPVAAGTLYAFARPEVKKTVGQAINASASVKQNSVQESELQQLEAFFTRKANDAMGGKKEYRPEKPMRTCSFFVNMNNKMMLDQELIKEYDVETLSSRFTNLLMKSYKEAVKKDENLLLVLSVIYDRGSSSTAITSYLRTIKEAYLQVRGEISGELGGVSEARLDSLLPIFVSFGEPKIYSSKYKTASDIFLPIEVSLYPKGGTSSVIKNPSLQELELKLKDYRTVANSDGLSVGLKFDKDVTMGIVEDVKEVIRTTLSHK
ncbi:M56 family metallopeptidase [Bacteroides cellulosilyticus]|uniref:M56 family metallopeptidase n=1 Tax=Bacteroides cellulosilyticus TaxID=246787 RepID=UPI0007605CF1|nr:M56 family metallopeptidase [Bacteroides cellulosilyticus]KWR51704.1 antirepressor regulating drug resistance [Bacteroides cellulosilyticus]